MKNILITFCIYFTVGTLFAIVINGFFYEWSEKDTENWGYIIGLLLLMAVITNIVDKRLNKNS